MSEQFIGIGKITILDGTLDGYKVGSITTSLYECTFCRLITTDVIEHAKRCKNDEEIEPLGAWFVFDYDSHPYPIGLYATEAEADHDVAGRRYGKVLFWEFGKEFTEVDV